MKVKRTKLEKPQQITNGRETVQIIEAETVDGKLSGFVVEGGTLPKPRYFPIEFLVDKKGFKVPQFGLTKGQAADWLTALKEKNLAKLVEIEAVL